MSGYVLNPDAVGDPNQTPRVQMFGYEKGPQLIARSCPSCHSMGSPRVVDRTLSGPMYCPDLWHTAVRQSDTAVRQSDTDAPTTGLAPRVEPEQPSLVPEEAPEPHRAWRVTRYVGQRFVWTWRQRLMCEPAWDNDSDRFTDLAELEAYDGPLTPAAVDDVPALLAEVERLRVADCGHDLEAFDRQARELAQARRRECSALCRDIEHDRDVLAAEVERLLAELARVPAETALIEAERDEARAALDRVRALHQEHEGWCTYCHEYCDCLDRVQDLDNAAQVARAAWDCTHRAIPWPCPTITALGAQPTGEETAGA